MPIRLLVILSLCGCTQTQQQAETVAMTITGVKGSSAACDWAGSSTPLLEGSFDLLSMVAPGGGIGRSRRYPIGVSWAVASAGDTEQISFGDAFITLKDVEVRLIFEDAVVAPPTDRTQQNLPATYVVPTMGTQDTPIAVFDLIPTWVARRLALDSQIWVDTSDGNQPRPGKAYLLATEFRLRGVNAGGKKVVSNWFRWVVGLCRGCQIGFTATPPMRPAAGAAVFPGHYSLEDLLADEPAPMRAGVVSWCAAGAYQAISELTLLQISQPLQTRQY